MGYRTAILRDSDKAVAPEAEEAFTNADGTLIAWRNGRAIEDELFLSLTDDGIDELIDLAIELHGEELVDDTLSRRPTVGSIWSRFAPTHGKMDIRMTRAPCWERPRGSKGLVGSSR